MALTIKDVAARLKLPVDTIHRWIRQGKIPMQRRGDTYIVHNEMLERWADEHRFEIQGQSNNDMALTSEDPEFDSVLLAMQRGGVFYDVQGGSRKTVLKAVVKHIPNVQPFECDKIYEKLLERELLASTGIGHGIALPHPRSNPDITLKGPQITTCFLANPVAFNAIDGQPVNIMMVLLSRSTKQHLVMLSKLSYYLRDSAFRDYLLTKPGRDEIFNKIKTIEFV